MKVGFVTDTHFGMKEEEDDVFETIQMLSSEFKARGVDTVIHLGDIAHEEPFESYVENVEVLQDVFADEFSFYMTMGNHDGVAVSSESFKERFDALAESVIYRNDGTSLILGLSAGDGEFANLGRLSARTIDTIRTEIEAGQDCLIATHYPVQFTDFHRKRPIFDIHPEYTFPVNKHSLTDVFSELDETQSVELVCGHLHPKETVTVETEPFEIPLTILEPVYDFEQSENGEILWSDNSSIDVDSLIWEL